MNEHTAEKDAPLRIDPERRYLHEATGFYVRAHDGERWMNADIAELNTDSLYRWLRSRGGDNPWAESVVLGLLGHDRSVTPSAEGDTDA